MDTKLPFHRFTDTAREVCQNARAGARCSRLDAIESEHLLMGLTQAGRKVGLIVLEQLGVTPPMIQAELARILHRGPTSSRKGKLPWGRSGS